MDKVSSPQASAPFSPGLIVVHSNRLESLRDVLTAWMQRYPLAPLESEAVLVQSNGMAQWLKLALAQDRPAQAAMDGSATGGCGIAAGLDVQLPAHFFWRAYRAVLGADAVPETSPFDKSLLVWRLMRLLPSLLTQAVFAPLQRFLQGDADLRRRYQLAQRLADTFDQYQAYRADWLDDWAQGRDVLRKMHHPQPAPLPAEQRWQAALWRALLQDVAQYAGPGAEALGSAHGGRAEVHRRFLKQIDHLVACGLPPPQGLPPRLLVFGLSSIAQQGLEVLAAVARLVPVLVCVHNPCEHYWGDIMAGRDVLRSRYHARHAPRPSLNAALLQTGGGAHPLLASWGKQGRDYIGLLEDFGESDAQAHKNRLFAHMGKRMDMFESPGSATMLQQLQDDILGLRPVQESRERWPAADLAKDVSIRFHVAHSAQREVEVLHDQLLDAFTADKTLHARDVIVMVPDIDRYAPHIQAVFGLLPADDPRYIPFTLADRGARQANPLLDAVQALWSLPLSRLAMSDVMDWLDLPALRSCFGISADQVPLLHRWLQAAKVRWGLHARQKQALGLPQAQTQNTWLFGLQRMLLGYAVGQGDAWNGIEPLDEIGGLDAALLGAMAQLLERLDSAWQWQGSDASPQEWGQRLRWVLGAFFDPRRYEDAQADSMTLQRLEQAMQDWLHACEAADMSQPLPLAVVREHVLAQLDAGGLHAPFLGGGVTFATLLPMRAIPFRMVCLLGMNDGDYPRQRVPADFDLMADDVRPGDRSRREDDRYLFLEALLSARERLYISWVGRSIHDNAVLPPSVLVAQLREHVQAVWRLAPQQARRAPEDGECVSGGLLPALTTEHRLQAFGRAYFDGSCDVNGNPLWSYAHEWRRGMPEAALKPTPRADDALPAWMPVDTLNLGQLRQFVRCPVRYFCQQRLQVFMQLPGAAVQDDEPFVIDGLQNWQLQDELIAVQRKAVHQGADREVALNAQLQRMARRGDLPQGHFARRAQESLAAPMEELFGEYIQALAAWPHAEKVLRLDIACELEDGSTLSMQDSLGDIRSNGENRYARLVISSTGLVEGSGAKAYRRDKIMPLWVEHLAAHVAGHELCTHVFSKAGKVVLPALRQHEARQHWKALLQAYRCGLHRPLPLALKTGFAWLKEGGSPDSAAHEAASKIYEAEAANNLYLARAWPDFEHLSASGDFAFAVQALLRPLWDATAPVAKEGKDPTGTPKASEGRRHGKEKTLSGPKAGNVRSNTGKRKKMRDAADAAPQPHQNPGTPGDKV